MPTESWRGARAVGRARGRGAPEGRPPPRGAGLGAGGGRVRSSTVLWGAGVLASPAGRWLGAAMDKSGKIIVGSDLSVPSHPEIFAIGDTAHVVALFSRNLLGIKSK